MLNLKHAIEESNYSLVKELIEKGANLNEIIPPDPEDSPWQREKTTLKVAIETYFKTNDIKIINLLLENNVNINLVDGSNNTVLHDIISVIYIHETDTSKVNQCFELIKFFAAKGLDLNLRNNDGDTGLNNVVKEKFDNKEIVKSLYKLLTELGADPRIKDNNGACPLDLASEYVQKTFDGKKTEIASDENKQYETMSLFEAARYKFPEPVKVVLAKNPRIAINEKDETGFTALMYAAKSENWEGAKLLIEHGADTNIRNNREYALIHQLAERISSEDPEEKNNKANDFLEFIISKDTSINSEALFNGEYQTPLQIASMLNNWLFCKTLIDNGGGSVNQLKAHLKNLSGNKGAEYILAYIDNKNNRPETSKTASKKQELNEVRNNFSVFDFIENVFDIYKTTAWIISLVSIISIFAIPFLLIKMYDIPDINQFGFYASRALWEFCLFFFIVYLIYLWHKKKGGYFSIRRFLDISLLLIGIIGIVIWLILLFGGFGAGDKTLTIARMSNFQMSFFIILPFVLGLILSIPVWIIALLRR